MNQDLQLKLQAFLDGELSERDSRRVADWVADNADAQALLAELRTTKEFLAEPELERTLPESREFYWSKISRQIARADRLQAPAAPPSLLSHWRRLLAPVAGVVLVVILGITAIQFLPRSAEDTYLSHLAEVETPIDEIGSYSFRSRSGNMFVVWLYDRTPEVAVDLEQELINDMLLQ